MRLPRHVVPLTYSLSLVPFIVPDNYTIAGSLNLAAKIRTADNKCNYKAGGSNNLVLSLNKITDGDY